MSIVVIMDEIHIKKHISVTTINIQVSLTNPFKSPSTMYVSVFVSGV